MSDTKKFLEILREINETPPPPLGDPPWSEESLRKSYFQNAMLKSIDTFRTEAESSKFWTLSARKQFKKRELAIRRGVFASATSAMALVDHSRKVVDKIKVPRYEDQKNQNFKNGEEHQFVQGLRNYVSHYEVAEANWRRSWSVIGKHTQFLLQPNKLLVWDEWNSLARRFISRHQDGIDIETVFRSYRDRVKIFHDWFHSALVKASEPHLSEYRGYEQTLNWFNARAFWDVMIEQVVKNRIDPYECLDDYLTQSEIKEVLALPMRSREQVDKIIEIVNEHRACDEKLRRAVYTVFGVDIPPTY